MAGWKELCLHEDVEKLILTRLQSSELLARMLAGAQREVVSRRDGDIGRVGEVALGFIKTSGFEVQLKNLVYHELGRLYHSQRTLPLLPPSLLCAEPVEYLRQAQESWEGVVRRRLNALATQLTAPLAEERSEIERERMRKRWNGIGTDYPVPKDLYSVYSPNDLLDVLVGISSPNAVRNGVTSSTCGLMNVQLVYKSLFDLRAIYSVLGVPAKQFETILRDNVLEMGQSSLAREVCKRGCPVTSRRRLWSLALDLDTTQERHAFHFEKLKWSVFRTHLLLEGVLVKEVKETTANDDNYFVFEDTILQVLFAFLHDYSILDQLKHINTTPIKAYIAGDGDDDKVAVAYPPCGIIPFHGLSFFVAPLCYVLARPDHVYAMFTKLYLRYFIHLSIISSHPQGVVGLCGVFESLLHARQPDLFHHLTTIEAPPLCLVFSWLATAFASQLDCRELLLLWDRVIGFDSLDIVAVFAVSVLEFRAQNLFKATCLSEAQAILSDLRCLKVLPLLHNTLFL